MEDFDGADALVLTLDFTNNSKEMSTYFWSVYGTAMQNDTELESAIIYTDYDAYEMIDDNQFEEVDPGATLEVQVAYVLEDTTSEVEVTFEEMIGSKNGKITIDPSALSRMESTSSPQSSEPTDDPVPNDSTLLDWWNGDWYGWWIMTGCAGYYEDMEGQWWTSAAPLTLVRTIWVPSPFGTRTTRNRSLWFPRRSASVNPEPASMGP